MTESKQWEYKAISLGGFWSDPNDAKIEAALNQLGQEGWEIISVVTQHGTNRVRAFAKRPLDLEARGRYSWPK